MISLADEDRLLLIPGPTPVHREILNALAQPTISHTSGQLAQEMKAMVAGLKEIADNAEGTMFVFAGSGTLAQEAAILNFVTPEDRLLVASNGFFARRLHEIARQHQLQTEIREATPGHALTGDELDRAIQESRATAVTFTHVETSTGVMAPLSEYLDIIQSHGARSIVDGVAAFGGVPEPMRKLGIDVLLTGAQKALGVPPGLAIIAAGVEAWKLRQTRTDRVPAFYADLSRWAPIMDEPDRYFSTHPVNLIRALAKAVRIILDEGLETRFQRHVQLAKEFRDGLAGLGFEPFTEAAYLAPTLSAMRTPTSILSSAFRRRLHEYGVVAAGGINDAEDRIVRFGHMGNVGSAEIAAALDAIARAVSGAGGDKPI